MKQKILYIILMIAALAGGRVDAWGQTTSYVLNVSQQYELNTIAKGDAFELSGPGATLTFEACKSPASVDGLYIETSVDGTDGSWSESAMISISENESKYVFPWWQEVYNWHQESYSIPNTDVRYIRFKTKTGATLTKYYKNVKVTRATSFSTTTQSIDFGNVAKNTSSTKHAVVHFENTTYNQDVEGTCTDASFSVTKTSVGETSYTGTWTGTDYTSTKPVNIPVTFRPSGIGAYSGTVTLTMNGKTATFQVKGTGTTTYYGKAVATNSEGGNAYVTFDPNDASGTTTSEATTNKVSSNTSTSSTAYYRAVPSEKYEFVGWTLGAGGEYVSTSPTFTSEILYSSENSTTPTETTYKAWFRPIYYFSASAECSYNHGSVVASVEESQKSEGPFTTQATFTATPNEGSTFEGWYRDREHTQFVSKNTTYTETITNNEPCSTANLTLYAWFKSNQTISWTQEIQDNTLIQGTTVDCSATSTSSLKVSYSSSNPAVASVDENGVVTANEPSNETVVITASQAGNNEYNAATAITRSFHVLQKLQPSFAVSGFTGVSPTLKVGATASITLANVDEEFTFSSSDNTVVGISRNGNVLTLTALKSGTADITLLQPANNTHNAASAKYTITVERHQGGLSISLPETMKVGDTRTGFWNTSNNEVTVVVESNNTNVITYSDGTLTAVGEGTAVVTVSQTENNKWAGESRQQTITVSKVANTLGVSLGAREALVGDVITVALSNQNNSSTPVTATITEQTLSSSVNNGTDVISYADGVITALNAGTAKITFRQEASAQYEGFASETYEISVTKHQNPISLTLNGGSALSINLKYGATASLVYSSNHSETPITVTRTSGSYTTLSGNTITAGNAAGADIYEVVQAETYKYEKGFAMFSIRVNNTNEEVGYVLYDETEYSHGTGAGVVHTYTLSGPGEILYYSARTQLAAIYYHLYVEYSMNNSDWIEVQDNQNLSDAYKDFSCAIPETARYVRFRFPGAGTLTKYINNVKVPRKTYVRASSDKTAFGTIYTGNTAQATFTVDYSTTNGGNIHVSSNNPNFVVSANELAVSNHSDGTKTFNVTYTPNPAQLGTESALITISDLFYSKEITLNATAAKRDNTLKVIGEQNLKVGDVVDNVYTDKNSDAELMVSMSREGVVSYDAASNRLTAVGEGSAVVTISQNANDRYHGVTKTISVNVSKNNNTLVMSVDKTNLKVEETATVSFTDKNSDGAITASYSVDGIVAYSDGVITALNAGTTRVVITQAATPAYPSVSQSFDIAVSKHDQTIQWDNELAGEELSLGIGQTLDTNKATASSNLAVTYSSSNPAALSVDPATGKLTAISSGVNITITATQAGNYKYNGTSITRNFTVVSKMDASVITTLSTSETNVMRIGAGNATISCSTSITEGNFTISGASGVVATTFENNTLTITPMKTGEVTITLTRAEDESYYAINQTYRIQVLGASAVLNPDEAPEFAYHEYAEITLNRTFPQGHSTLALPFDTKITDFSESGDAYAAQLAIVTHNAKDKYTLYLKKVEGGNMMANQPYIVYLPSVKGTFVWSNVTIGSVEPSAKTEGENEHFQGWTMQANYTPNTSMVGKYGIVGGKLCLGTAGSYINAYTAYFVPPTQNASVRMAILEDDGGVTYIDDIRADGEGVSDTESIYRLDGTRQTTLTKGINIVRMANGEVRKVLK